MDFPLVTFCGIPMGYGAAQTNGCDWIVSGIDGWDSPPVRTSNSDPSGRHGTSQSPPLYGGREMLMPGTVIGSNRADIKAAWRTANGLLDELGASDLLVVEDDPTVWLEVKKNQKHSIPAPVDLSFGFLFSIIADVYPFKRAVTARTQAIAVGATQTLTNDGTRAAVLKVSSTGAGTVVLQQMTSGQVMQTRTSVASGTVFDGTRKRVTTSGGVDIFPMGSPSEWLTIPREAGTPVKNLGTAPVLITWYDTYP